MTMIPIDKFMEAHKIALDNNEILIANKIERILNDDYPQEFNDFVKKYVDDNAN